MRMVGTHGGDLGGIIGAEAMLTEFMVNLKGTQSLGKGFGRFHKSF
jgi:hypothetical protein